MCIINLFYRDNDVDPMGQVSRTEQPASTKKTGLELILFEQVQDIYKYKKMSIYWMEHVQLESVLICNRWRKSTKHLLGFQERKYIGSVN